MPSVSPFEKRMEARVLYDERGTFTAGDDMAVLRLRDAAQNGVGAYSRVAFGRGDKGTLTVSLSRDNPSSRYDTEVKWCAPCDDPEFEFYPFRLGLTIKPREIKPVAKGPAISKVETGQTAQPASRQGLQNYRIKGSLLIDFAKAIQRHHDKPWQNYLTLEDMKIINDMIIPSAWYPADTFQRAGKAVLQEFGKGDKNLVAKWGSEMIKRTPDELFKSFFDKGDPKRAIRNYVNINKKSTDFLKLVFKDKEKKSVELSLSGDQKIKSVFPEYDLLLLIFCGAACEIAKKNGAKRPEYKIIGSDEEHLFSIEISWT